MSAMGRWDGGRSLDGLSCALLVAKVLVVHVLISDDD